MGYQLWLPDALSDIGVRRLSVEPEWDRRGSINFAPKSVGAHHTGAANDITAMLRDGRPGLSGPLCNVEIRKSGEVRVIAAGRANHAGTGGFRGLTGNSSALGIEPTSDGKNWASAVLDVYPLVLAALCRGIGRDESWVWGHKEWTSRKWDPGALDMNWLRSRTGLLLNSGPAPTPAPIEEDDMHSTPFDLDPGESVRLSVEPADGFFGKTASLLVLDVRNADGEQPVWVWHQFTGGGAKGGPDGKVVVRGGQRFTRAVSGGWLDVRNDGKAPVFGALLTKRV